MKIPKPAPVRWWPLLLLLASWPLTTGCLPTGTGDLSGTLQVADCPALQSSTSWQLQVGYVTLQTLAVGQGDDRAIAAAELRIQMHPGSLTQADVAPQDLLLLSIQNPARVQAGQDIPIETYVPRLSAEIPGEDPHKVVARGVFSLGKTCPSLPYPSTFGLKGTLNFSKFALVKGQAIEGTLRLEVSKTRPSSAEVKGALQGNFALTHHPPDGLGDDILGALPKGDLR